MIYSRMSLIRFMQLDFLKVCNFLLQFRLQIFYDLRDEHEIIRRILSFGPTIKLQGPGRFIALIQEQLKKQLQYQQQR